MARFPQKKKHPSIGELRDRVVVCTWTETPDNDISVVVKRPGVYSCNARVLPLRGSKILDYQTAFGEKAPTHEITMRVPLDVHLALNHWIFCQNKFSQTWYRVANIEDVGGVHRWISLLCYVDTVDDKRSDPATQQSPPNFIEPVQPPDVI